MFPQFNSVLSTIQLSQQGVLAAMKSRGRDAKKPQNQTIGNREHQQTSG
jgi:hypothetical protein